MILFSMSSLQLEDGKSFTPLDTLIKREEATGAREAQKKLAKAIGTLNHRSRVALLARFSLHPQHMTIPSLATSWGVSRQRVYQIAAEAINELRRHFRRDEK